MKQGKRILSIVLLAAMLLSLLPTSLFTPKAKAALTQTQLTKSDALKAEIEGLSAPIANNQVQELPIANTDEELDAANTLLKNLSGTYYVLMSVTPTGEESPRYFALNPTTAEYTGTLAAEEVQVVDGSVIGADASWAVKMEFLNLTTYPNSSFSTAGYRSARTPYSMQTSSGKYLQFETVEHGISLVESSNTTITFFSYYATPHYLTPQYNNDASYRLRLNANNPDDIYFDLGVQGNIIAYSNQMLLYKIDETMVNAASLYDAILEAGEHLGTCNPYEEANYQAFLTTLEESIDLYEANNGAKPSDVAAATAAVAAQEQKLRDAMLSVSSYTEQIEALKIPYSELYPITKYVSQLDLAGKWFALTKKNGFYWAMDVAKSGSGKIGVACIDVANDSVVTEDDLQHAIDLIHYEADPNNKAKYTVLLEERTFLRPESRTNIKLAKPLYFILERHASLDGSFSFRRFFDVGRDLELVDDMITFGANEKSGSPFYLFRPSPATLELYQALHYVARYGHGNANGQYPQELYDEFAALVEESLALYQQYNNDQSAATLAMKETLDGMAADLRGYAVTLTNADKLTSYIDIPVEILDFRSDTFLLEYAVKYNRYAMTGSNVVTAPNIPGDLYTGPDGTVAREGLVCEDLIDGQMIYKEETVTYLAKLLLTDDDSSGDITELMPRFTNVNYMTDFRTLINDLIALNATDPTAALGSMEDTLTKVIPNKEELQVNGCVLPWSEVTTAHDLAYYALNNLWRKVDDTDVLSDGMTYNVSVPQRDRIRMYQNADGYYTLDSNYDTVYDGYYIYNTAPHLPISKVEGTGEFMPIDDMGFENGITEIYEDGNNPAETDPSAYFAKEGYEKSNETANFHFSIHAYGSFVYYESQDLYFSFEGDDDVYFFINGHSVLELGGCHNPIYGELELNRIADKLGLVDGEVYSFDMFYAERHTNGSNIRFSTNMKIVDTEMVPTKGQYGEIIDGHSNINSATGMGSELIDNALINIGDTVAYSFDILNLRSVPVYNISFDDKSLGAFVSPQTIKLYDPALSNGVETKITDIKIFYRTYDHINNDITEPGTINADVPIVMSYDQIVAMIDAAKTDEANNFSLPKGSYRVDIETEKQLQNLLALGAPADCQISVYGFKRNTIKQDRPYVNTMVANCYYRRAASAETNETEEEFLLTGSASRQLLVPDVDAITRPTVDPEQIVIDFAKEVEIPTANLKDHIYTNRHVPIGKFLGLTATGYNGAFLKSLPADLGCKSTASGKNTFQSPNGIYTRTANSFKFQLTEFLSEIERVYAVYEISNYHVLDENGRSTEYKYILVEIQIIPATQMYYETDFSGTAINAENYNGSLYFGFDNSDDDKRRYDTATYNYTNFDSESPLRWTRNGSVVQKREVDNEAGTLTLIANNELPEDTWPCVYFENAAAFNFNPKNAEIYQVRIKMENFVRGTQSGSDKSPYTNITYVPEGGTSHVSALANTGAIALSHLSDGTYITVTAEVTEEFRAIKNITKLRFMFGGMESDPNGEPGKLTIDYIYLGPKDESLFFDFTDTESDRLRYEAHTYRATNFDDPSNWKEDAYFTDAIIDGNLVLTTTPAHNEKTDGYASVNSGWKVEHPVREDDYVFIRMRMVGVKKLNGTPTLRFYYGDSHQSPMAKYGYGEWTFTEDDFDGEWLDLSYPLAKSPNYFAAIKYICLSFYQVRSVDTANPGQIIFDYIFVGTPEEHERLKGPFRNSNPWELLTWSDVADGTQSTEQQQDFDYVTDTVYDMIVDREVIPENAFFVDFDNDNARYNSSSIYGGYNFDLAANGYWATAGADGATAFTIDNTEGIVKLDVPAEADSSGKYGPSVATTNSYGNYPTSSEQSAYFPLSYTSTSSDYIQLRFRIDGCEWTGENETVTFAYNYSTEAGFAYAEDITLPYTTKTMGEYQTLNLTIPNTAAFKSASNVESFALHFGGIKEKSGSVGTVTIDYIFVGPKVGMPSDVLTNNAIYLSFDNDDPAKIRYSSDIYTQTNMDDPGNWKDLNWFDMDISDGSMNLTPTAQDSKDNGYGRVSTLEKLNYAVTGNEYVQVRLRIDGAKKIDGYTPTFKLFFGTSNNSNLNEGSLAWVIDPIKHIDQGWITFTAPLSKSKKQYDIIRYVSPAFYAMRSVDLENPATYAIDYIYIGPMNGNEIITPSEDALYFNFSDTDADKYRYSSPIYGGTNYDDDETVNWTLHPSRVQNVAVNQEAGTLELTALDELPYDSWPDVFVETAHNLNYSPKNAEIFQIRFRLENFVRGTENDEKINFYLSPSFYSTGSTTRTSLLYGNDYYCHLDYITNDQYLTITAQLSEAFRTCESVEAIRLYIGGIESDPAKDPGKVHIDYLYIGPSVESNPAASSLYFGFDDLAEDRERYNTDTYGYRNFDDTTQWVKTSKISDMQIDNDKGLMNIVAAASLADTSWPDAHISTPKYFLDYKPENAEVYQIRFKLEGFEQGSVGTSLKNAYINISYNHRDETNSAAAVIPDGRNYSMDYLDNELYLTLTGDLPSDFINANHIDYLRLYFGGIETKDPASPGVVTIDYAYIGPRDRMPQKALYGYDASYDNDTMLSNGESLLVEGRGIPKMNSEDHSLIYEGIDAYTEASFHFTGTGFDIISRTGVNQGAVRAVIYKADGTYLKTISVVNKSENNLELYQVPVISTTVPYGSYEVKLLVNSAYDYGNDGNGDDYGGALDRGGEFYFDAIRIYDPINTLQTDADSVTAYEVYQKHEEADPYIVEARKALIDTKSYNAGGDMEGALYLDKGETGASIGTYASNGPNNEIYLKPGQAIAFKLVTGSGRTPSSLDVAAKSADGKPVNLTVTLANAAPDAKPTKQNVTIRSCTAQYYATEFTVANWKTNNNRRYTFVTIYNASGEGILSITDIKAAYNIANPPSSRSIRFVVDGELLEALNAPTGEDEPALNEALDFDMRISAGADMKVAYTIKAETVAAYDSFYLTVNKSVAGGEAVSTTYDLSNLTVTNDPTTGEAYMYTAIFDGINAKEMGDVFEATLYAVDADGKLYCSTTNASSIKSYLLEKLNDESTIDALKTMAVDMLNYGAAAQLHFAYDTENLVNADLTDAQKAYATSELPEAVNSSATSGEGVALRTSVSVKEKVYLNLTATYTPTDASALKVVICDTDGKVIAELPVTVKNNVLCQTSYGEVGAKQMRQLLTATLYEGDKAVSNTITWSVESYVAATRANANASATQIAMVNAMLTYGDAVAAYLTASGQ